jgi:hypothetical protein
MSNNKDYPCILFTCRTSEGKYAIPINGVDVLLTNGELQVLADLVLGTLKGLSGLSRLPSVGTDRNARHQAVYRLRRAIDAALGCGSGERLIIHGGASEYYLKIVRDAIVIDQSVADLAPAHLPLHLVNELLEHCEPTRTSNRNPRAP